METVNPEFHELQYSSNSIRMRAATEAWGEGGFRFSEETDVDLAKQGTCSVSVHWCLGFLDGMLKLVVSSHYESFGATKCTRVQGEITRMP